MSYRSLAEVGELDNLLDSAYGTALLGKSALLALLVPLAASNFLLVKLCLAGAGAPPPSANVAPSYRRLRLAVVGEVLVLVAVLAVTSVLTGLPPAREAFGAGLVVRGQAQDLRAVLVVAPGLAGVNSFDVYLRDGAGHPIVVAEKVALIFTLVEHDMGETEAVAANVGGRALRCPRCLPLDVRYLARPAVGASSCPRRRACDAHYPSRRTCRPPLCAAQRCVRYLVGAHCIPNIALHRSR